MNVKYVGMYGAIKSDTNWIAAAILINNSNPIRFPIFTDRSVNTAAGIAITANGKVFNYI